MAEGNQALEKVNKCLEVINHQFKASEKARGPL